MKTIRLLFITLLYSSLCLAQQKELKLMSYNIRIASPPSKGWGITELNEIAGVINRNPHDLIALQEVDRFTRRSGLSSDQAKELSQLTDMNYFFAKAVDRDGGDYGVGILSKYPILHAEAHRIYAQDSIKHEHRALAIVKIKWNNEDIIFASFHLDHLADSTRKFQLNQILKHLEKFKNHKIIMGADLNIQPDNVLFSQIKKSNFHVLQDNMEQPTFPNNNPKVTLDYLLFNDAFHKKHKHKAFKVLKHENYASDHLPITLIIQSK